jgi:hypothetical protein
LFKEEVCSYNNFLLIAKLEIGHAMAEAVSCCLSPQRLRFVPLLVHVVFVVEKMTLGQVFLSVICIFPVNVILLWLSMLVYHVGMKNSLVGGRSSET